MGKNKKNQHFYNIHLLVGYCPQTIPEYRKMISKMRETFPEIRVKDVKCSKVIKSSVVYGFTIITWNGYLTMKNRKGLKKWRRDKKEPEYFYA